MKIVFLTGCLEFGKDGVADYLHILANECARLGHEPFLVSLNDCYASKLSRSDLWIGSSRIPVLRIPSALSWNERMDCAVQFVESHKADWISLQFVPYSFDQKGMVAGLGKRLLRITKKKNTHIMFHELWAGSYKGSPLRERLRGEMQKFFILRLIRKIKPRIVHANSSTYVTMLNRYGAHAARLPLFGLVPLVSTDASEWLFPRLQRSGLDIRPDNRNAFRLFGFFGTLHPRWPGETLLAYLHELSVKYQFRAAVISIGNLKYGEQLWEKLSKDYSPKLTFLKLGEQASVKISEFLNIIDFGITSVPYNIIGKSGTTISMLEHGLPVIASWQGHELTSGYPVPPEDGEPLLFKIGPELEKLIATPRRFSSHSRAGEVAMQFIQDL